MSAPAKRVIVGISGASGAVYGARLLQALRESKPEATFVFTSTNKVYGDRPNYLPLEDTGTRLELPAGHEYFGGIPTSMSIDHTMHSVFGASKVAADVLVQETPLYANATVEEGDLFRKSSDAIKQLLLGWLP